jgi:hypothetical protein
MDKGIKQQIEEGNLKHENDPLTIEKINQVIGEVFSSDRAEQDTFAIYQSCKTKGIVLRTEKDLGLCNDPECSSCSELTRIITKSLKENPNILNSNFK